MPAYMSGDWIKQEDGTYKPPKRVRISPSRDDIRIGRKFAAELDALCRLYAVKIAGSEDGVHILLDFGYGIHRPVLDRTDKRWKVAYRWN